MDPSRLNLGFYFFTLISSLIAIFVSCETDTLSQNSKLNSGQYLISVDGYYKLVYESSGIVTGYSVLDGTVFWQSNGPILGSAGKLTLQSDCNLVAYSNFGLYYFATMTTCSANVPYKLQILNTRDIVLYDSIGNAKWHSNTAATDHPSTTPTAPTRRPTLVPSTFKPSQSPTRPSIRPSSAPSVRPSFSPSKIPTSAPSIIPSKTPTAAPSTYSPSSAFPSFPPTRKPTWSPSLKPSTIPTNSPTPTLTNSPTFISSVSPTVLPTSQIKPTFLATYLPTISTSNIPSNLPSCLPTLGPSMLPTIKPSMFLSSIPTCAPTSPPSFTTLYTPTSLPSSIQATAIPSLCFSISPSSKPSNSNLPSSIPVVNPTLSPTAVSTRIPKSPTATPTELPTSEPLLTPSMIPTCFPMLSPTDSPSEVSTSRPFQLPSLYPTVEPSLDPSKSPSWKPSAFPSVRPTTLPSLSPTHEPSTLPTTESSVFLSLDPTIKPSQVPTVFPSSSTTKPSPSPTAAPSISPTEKPSGFPTAGPSSFPSFGLTTEPSLDPSESPSTFPSVSSTTSSSLSPTHESSTFPSIDPIFQPSQVPTLLPSSSTTHPSLAPTAAPSTEKPSSLPSFDPTENLTTIPSLEPSFPPSGNPTIVLEPSTLPTAESSMYPSLDQTIMPSQNPTMFPSSSTTKPSLVPTDIPSISPTEKPSGFPTTWPTSFPSLDPTVEPSLVPSKSPSWKPSAFPSVRPTTLPSLSPTHEPSTFPTAELSVFPSLDPTIKPSQVPTIFPSSSTTKPSPSPTAAPSISPTEKPSDFPTAGPSSFPSFDPTFQPSQVPTIFPSSSVSTFVPSLTPSALSPTDQPSELFKAAPSNTPSSNTTLNQPYYFPSQIPSDNLSFLLTESPTFSPSADVTLSLSSAPNLLPSTVPTESPTSVRLSAFPLILPSNSPSNAPSVFQTKLPTELPSSESCPSLGTVFSPSTQSTDFPSISSLTNFPSVQPASKTPTGSPLLQRTDSSEIPTVTPSASQTPSLSPSGHDSSVPTNKPSAFAVESPAPIVRHSISSHVPSYPSTAAPITIDSINMFSDNDLDGFNTHQRLLLQARILSAKKCSTNWTVSDSSISLSSISLVPIHQDVFPYMVFVAQLYLSGDVFSAGNQFLFTCHCGSLFASLTVTTNMPPVGGTFDVHPTFGYELSTNFLFKTSMWFDSDLPLQYLFGYIDPSTTKQLSISTESTAQSVSSCLPSGREASSYVLNTTLVVSDALSSYSSIFFATVVQPSSNSALLVNTTSTLSLNMINVIGSFLNKVNCTGISNCVKLNRHDCSSVDFTCGDCFPDYIGESGPHNSMCVKSSSNFNGEDPSFCRTDSDCGSFQICQIKSERCFLPSKECVNSCSSRGNCSFVSRNYRTHVAECKISSSDCDAVCSCHAGYAGSSCSFTSAELKSRISIRYDILQSIGNIIKGGNISAGFIITMGSTLSAATQKVDQLSSDSVTVTLAILDYLLKSAGNNGVGYFDLADVLSAGDFAASACGNGTHSAQIVRVSNQFNFIVAQQILPSQGSIVNILNTFRTITSVVKSEKGSVSTSISVPQTPLETLESSFRGGVEFVQNVSNSESFTVSITETNANLFYSSHSLVSNALAVHISNLQVLSKSNTTSNSYDILVSLKYASLPEFSQDDVNFTTHCTQQMSESRIIRQFFCTLGSTVLIHNCTNKVGTHTSFCPAYRPSCRSFPVAGSDVGTVCRTVNYTVDNILCLCTVPSILKISRRSLSNSDISVELESATFQVASMSELVSNTFKNTFTLADSLSSPQNIQKVLIVILMFSSIWLFGIVLTLACYWRRKKMKIKNKELADLRDTERQEAEKAKGAKQVRNYLVEYILEAFPSVFRERSRVYQVTQEIRRHHRYLSLFFSPETGDRADALRIIKVAQLLTIQTMLMFLLALFYELQSPSDDRSCQGWATRQTCLARKSALDASQSYCEWIVASDGESTQSGYICSYRDPVFTAQMILIIAVLVSVITATFSRPIEYLFRLLASPTADSKKATAAFIDLNRSAATAVRRASVVALNASKAVFRNAAMTLPAKRLIVGAETILFPNSMVRAQELAHASIKTISVRAAVMIQTQEQEAFSAKSRLEREAVDRPLAPENRSLEGDEKSHSSSSKIDDDLDDVGERANEEQTRLASTVHRQSLTTAPQSMTELMDQLKEDITLQRKLLPYSEVEEYDMQWGLDPTGDFTREGRIRCCGLVKPLKGAREAILKMIETVKKVAGNKVEQLKIATDEHTGLEILHLFILDLLGRDTPAAIIFEQKVDEDFKRTKVVTKFTKYLAVAVLLALNVFFGCYGVLYGYKQGLEWQQSYLFACIAQMFVEIFINETLEVVWLNFFLPTLVANEVYEVSSSLIERVNELCIASPSTDKIAKRRLVNVPDYLFVSTSVAKAYPKLMESVIVQTYTTHLPGELAKKWTVGSMQRMQSSMQRVNKQRSRVGFVSLTAILAVGFGMLKYMATAPFTLQRILVRLAQPVFVSGIVMAFYAILYSPINIAVFFACLTAAVGYFALVYRRDSARRSKMLVQPINEVHEVVHEPESVGQEDSLVPDGNVVASSVSEKSPSLYSEPLLSSEDEADDIGSGSSYCFLSIRSEEPVDSISVQIRNRVDSECSGDMYDIDFDDLSSNISEQ